MPENPLPALLPGRGPSGQVYDPYQQQDAFNALATGQLLGMQGQQDFGNILLSTLGGAPAFNPFARLPQANPLLAGLPPEITALFSNYAPISLESVPAVQQEQYRGQTTETAIKRLAEHRQELQRMNNNQLGLPKDTNDQDRNAFIAQRLNEFGVGLGLGENSNALLSGAAGYGDRRPPGEGNDGVPYDTLIGDIHGGNYNRAGRSAGKDTVNDQPAPQSGPVSDAVTRDGGLTALLALGGTLAGAGASVGSAAIGSGGGGGGKVPAPVKPAAKAASDRLLDILGRNPVTSLGPTTAPLSAFEIAGLGQIANQALNPQFQAAPITQAPTFRPLR